MSDLIGHDSQWRQLSSALAAGRLHHGLILSGPRGVGKASFARALAAQIVDPDGAHGALTRKGNHPDIIVIERLPKEMPKEGEEVDPGAERKRSITVDQIRRLQSILSKKPAISSRRAIVIDAADDFETSTSNALLKSLEEPPEGCHFLLVSHSADRLLPTIRSRCQQMAFERLSDENLRNVLQRMLPDSYSDELSALMGAGDGSPGQAMEFAGLEIAEMNAQIQAIIGSGDRDNAIRVDMAAKLALKAAQPRYEAFLRRVPSVIASFARGQEARHAAHAVDCWEKAAELASRATALTLDKKAVILEMGSLLAALNTHKQAA